MNLEINLKNLIKSFVNNKDEVEVFLKKNENNVNTLNVNVNENDMKKVIGSGGRVYRSIKTIVRYYFNEEYVDIIINNNSR